MKKMSMTTPLPIVEFDDSNYIHRLQALKIKGSRDGYTAYDLYEIVKNNRTLSDINKYTLEVWPDHKVRSFELMYGNFYILFAAVELVCMREPKKVNSLIKYYKTKSNDTGTT